MWPCIFIPTRGRYLRSAAPWAILSFDGLYLKTISLGLFGVFNEKQQPRISSSWLLYGIF
jgi:hypothetical membrane protein